MVHLSLTDWKCLRLTSRTIYRRLSSVSSYSHHHPIYLAPKSSSGATLFDSIPSIKGVELLLLSNIKLNELYTLLETSESFRALLQRVPALSFARSTSLIDTRIFYDLLARCPALEKLDLSDYQFFFLSHNFNHNSKPFPSIQRLNLSGNTHLSDFAFNRLIVSFPNIVGLHLLGIPLRSCVSSVENRTLLTFENICSYVQKHQERFQALTVSFDASLPCDVQVKRLFLDIPPRLTYLHIDGSLTISTLLHLLLLFDNRLETLIIGRLLLDHHGCQPLFAAITEYAFNLKQLCVFLNPSVTLYVSQQKSPLFPGQCLCTSSHL